MPTELKINKKQIGKSGTPVESGIYTEEYLSQLQGFEAASIYNKMRRSDAQVRKIMSAIVNPIRSADWSIEPASDENKDIEVAALMDQILFKDIFWGKFLNEALTCIPHGHSVFEVVHDNKDNKELGQYTGLAQLGFRNQTTLIKWNHDEKTGDLKSIEQEQTGDIDIPRVVLPVDVLMLFLNEPEGDNNGFPVLRPLYGAYKRKLLIKELEIIGIERFAIPTPMLVVPQNVKPDDVQYKSAEEKLRQFTNAENAYIMSPEGWPLTLNNNTFDPSKVEAIVKAENEEMASAVVATFLELGIGGNGGAFALTNDLSDFFLNGIESFANVIRDVINRELIPNLVKLNFADTVGVMPALTYSGISNKAGKELMEVITGYTASGIVKSDEILEDYVRKINKLPKKAEGTVLENQDTETEGAIDENNTDSEADTSSDASVDSDPSDSTVDIIDETALKLADPKTPRPLIEVGKEKTAVIMRDKLKFISDKYIADVLKKYKQLPDSSKLKAIDGIKVGGIAKFRQELKAALTALSTEALDMARLEVPEKKDVKLKDNETAIRFLDKHNFKFNEFSKLPKHVQLLLAREADLISSKQATDITDRVAFTFMSTEKKTNDINVIKDELTTSADEFIQAGVVDTAAANASATMVNESRRAFFYDPEVLEEIDSFTYVNPKPKSDICQYLAGKTVSSSDSDGIFYQPPLHHNCKTYLSPNPKTMKRLPKHEILAPTEKDMKSITLKGMY